MSVDLRTILKDGTLTLHRNLLSIKSRFTFVAGRRNPDQLRNYGVTSANAGRTRPKSFFAIHPDKRFAMDGRSLTFKRTCGRLTRRFFSR